MTSSRAELALGPKAPVSVIHYLTRSIAHRTDSLIRKVNIIVSNKRSLHLLTVVDHHDGLHLTHCLAARSTRLVVFV